MAEVPYAQQKRLLPTLPTLCFSLHFFLFFEFPSLCFRSVEKPFSTLLTLRSRSALSRWWKAFVVSPGPWIGSVLQCSFLRPHQRCAVEVNCVVHAVCAPIHGFFCVRWDAFSFLSVLFLLQLSVLDVSLSNPWRNQAVGFCLVCWAPYLPPRLVCSPVVEQLRTAALVLPVVRLVLLCLVLCLVSFSPCIFYPVWREELIKLSLPY